MPQPKKSGEERQRRHELHVIDGRAHKIAVPPAPEDLPPAVAAWWDAYRESDLAATFRPVHEPALLRLFGIYAEAERLEAAKAALDESDVFVTGSTGQTKLHPVYDELRKLRAEALALEREFGLTPKAMEALGLAVAEKTKKLSDIGRAILDKHGGDGPSAAVVEV